MYVAVFLDDEYERSACDLLRAWLRPGDKVVDVGANHGWFSLLMAAIVGPQGVVVACEPMPQMLDALRHNLTLNAALDVRVLPIALGAEPGESTLHLFAGLPHGHVSVSTLGRSDYATTVVPVERIDTAVLDLQPVLIKVDVEGAELEVLRGADALLRGRRPPSWLIEVNYETSSAMGYAPIELYDYVVAAHDYSLYRVVDGGLLVERDPEDAPQGSTWLFVSTHDQERLGGARVIRGSRGRVSPAALLRR